MRLSIFGLGYVGSVSAACFADAGHTVIGVDPNQTKVDLINAAAAPVVEAGLGPLIAKLVGEGKLRATTNEAEAVAGSDLSMICVGTPSQANGSLGLNYLVRVCEQIGAAIKAKGSYHTVVVRSTILPGTIRDVVAPTLEKATGMKVNEGFGLCTNPEFLREGTALNDFHHPPKTVIGESDARSGDVVAALYAGIEAPLIRCPIQVAEMVKYADNAWHGVKVAFANEIGNICKAAGIDSHRVMEIFCQDRKLNLSPYYLKPGFAFGGSCLPKDLRALTYKARSLDVQVPLLASVLPSNDLQTERGIQMILEKEKKKVGILGFSFKAGTDDLRESPIVEVIERLLGKGHEILLYDKNVNLAKLTGANREYILKIIPHIARLMVDSIDAVLAHAEVVVIGNADPEFKEVPGNLGPGQVLIDFVRIQDRQSEPGVYDGICW